MPIFGETSSPFDEAVEKVTDEKCTGENWSTMLDISDQVASEGSKAAKLCLLAIRKRLNNRDPHVIVLALSLLDCVWCNSGVAFRREVSSKDFCAELRAKATHSNRIVGEKTRLLIKKWASEECKSDPSLALVETLYHELVSDGLTFDTTEPKKTQAFSNDPNVVMSAKEEEDLAIALANSMKDMELEKRATTSHYPTTALTNGEHQKKFNERQVRALYDFEAAEDNEISFATGDVITVTDDSDPNWWRGIGPKGSGLFPSSFVTSDLNEPASVVTVQKKEPELEPLPATIDPNVLERCIELLQECDPRGEKPDSPELAVVEEASMAQAKLIDEKLANIDKQHNMLAAIDIKIRNVLALYDNAVQQLNYQMQAPMYGNAVPNPGPQPEMPNLGQQMPNPCPQPQMPNPGPQPEVPNPGPQSEVANPGPQQQMANPGPQMPMANPDPQQQMANPGPQMPMQQYQQYPQQYPQYPQQYQQYPQQYPQYSQYQQQM